MSDRTRAHVAATGSDGKVSRHRVGMLAGGQDVFTGGHVTTEAWW